MVDMTRSKAMTTPQPLRNRFALWYRNYITRKALRRLERARLADIGLTPEEARREIKKWFWMS